MTNSDQSVSLPPEVTIKVDGSWFGKIGRIDSVFLGDEDHGIFSVNLGFDFGGSHQGLGYIALGTGDEPKSVGIKFLRELCRVVGPLTECKGRQVIVLYDTDNRVSSATIRGLKPLIGGRPVIFDEIFGR